MKTEDIVPWALYQRGLYCAASKELNYYLKHEFLRWQSAKGWPTTCAICKKFVTRSQRSLDHIIPKSICWELGLENLIIDPRNFRMTHRDCNSRRSSYIGDLPQAVRTKLRAMRKQLQMDVRHA